MRRERTSGTKSSSRSPAIEALTLLGKWTRLAQGHMAFGSGCSCGAGLASLQVKDFEQQILDFLEGRRRDSPVAAMMRRTAGYRPGESGSIAELLRAIATQADVPVSADDQLALLSDLGRSIDSFEELHR